jgi:hypothetical protein
MYIVVIHKPYNHHLLRSVEVKTEQLRYDLDGTLHQWS